MLPNTIIKETAHDKTYNETCLISKDSDQPVHPPSMTRVVVYPSLDSPEAVEGMCNQQRLRSDCADAQTDLCLRWSHVLCRFCQALAQITDATLKLCLRGIWDLMLFSAHAKDTCIN